MEERDERGRVGGRRKSLAGGVSHIPRLDQEGLVGTVEDRVLELSVL